MSKKKYLENPTEYSALSYWKSKNFKVPDNMKIVNDKYFSKDLLVTKKIKLDDIIEEDANDMTYTRILKVIKDVNEVIAKKLNEQLDIIGGANKTDLTDNNIGVNHDNGKLKGQLAKN